MIEQKEEPLGPSECRANKVGPANSFMEFESTRMYVHTQSLLDYANFEKDTEKKS